MEENDLGVVVQIDKIHLERPFLGSRRIADELSSNGLLRQYLPKSDDLRKFTPDQPTLIAEELNTRPRKSLDGDTPAERFSALLKAT